MEITDSYLRRLCAEIIALAGRDARSEDVDLRTEAREWLVTGGIEMADQIGFSVFLAEWVAELELLLDKPSEM